MPVYDYRNIDNWLHHACAGIRFAPDREAVQEELRAHYEDACDAMTESGLSQEDAEELALRGMGDADELAPALAKAHNSIWTLLWLISRWLRRRVLIILIWFIFCFVIPDTDTIYFYEYGELTLPRWAEQHRSAVVPCNAQGTYAGYDWTITEWSRSGDELAFELTLRDHTLSAHDPILSFWKLELHDDQGNMYTDANRLVGIVDGMGPANYGYLYERSFRFLSYYEYTMTYEGIPEETEWIELRVPSSDFALQIDLTKGEK